MDTKKLTGNKAASTNPGRKTEDWKGCPEWGPMDGVSIGRKDTIKTSGIKIRGTGAATKGTMARGPMA